MTNFLLHTFVKNSENVKDPDVRASYGRFAGIVGVCCNVLLGGGKMLAGLLFQSIAVLADGINNLSDAMSSLVTLICFKMSSRPADKEHPFGHARMEYVSGLVVAVLILMVSFNLMSSSFEKIIHPEETPFSWISIGVLAVSIAVKGWMMLFNRKLGKMIDSTALEATAIDSRNDVIATSAVLVSTLVAKWSGLKLDGIAGMLIALFILWSGINLIRDTLSPLLGEAPDRDLVKKTMKRLRSYDGVLGIHDLMVHDYGPGRCFATVHVEVDAREDVMVSHDLCDNIERDFLDSGIHLVVHMDPIITDDEELNVLRQQVVSIVAGMNEGITMHDFRIVRGYSHTNVIFDIVVPSGCKRSEDSLRQEIQEKVSAIDPAAHYFTVVSIDRNYTELM
ncbi:MAG: cation diffusion facilitator family transporter [Candidatus Merdivicinus sp.]|jgi:cation diffusion facilitator family transporter